MSFLEKSHPTPPLLNPAKNPLLPWLFVPFGFCLGLLLLYWAIEQEYLLVPDHFTGCTVTRNYKKSTRLVNSMFQCAEDPNQKFYFRSKTGDTDEILNSLDGKLINFQFDKGKVQSDVERIQYGQTSFEGKTIATDGLLMKIVTLLAGIFACFSAILIWILKFRWRE